MTWVLGSSPVVIGMDVLLSVVVGGTVLVLLAVVGCDVVTSVENGASVVVNRDVSFVVSVEAVVVVPSVGDDSVVTLDVGVCDSEIVEDVGVDSS